MTASWLPESAPRPRRLAGSWFVAVCVLAACLGGLGTAIGFSRVSHPAQVLMLAGTVLQGDVIEAGDLGVAEVTAPGAPTVPAADRDSVVGTRALTTLPAGSLLAPESYGLPKVAAGMTQVTLRLSPSQVPVSPLPGGMTVVLLGLPGLDDKDGAVRSFAATVVFPPVPQVDGSVVMDVAVDRVDIEALAPYMLGRRVAVAARLER